MPCQPLDVLMDQILRKDTHFEFLFFFKFFPRVFKILVMRILTMKTDRTPMAKANILSVTPCVWGSVDLVTSRPDGLPANVPGPRGAKLSCNSTVEDQSTSRATMVSRLGITRSWIRPLLKTEKCFGIAELLHFDLPWWPDTWFCRCNLTCHQALIFSRSRSTSLIFKLFISLLTLVVYGQA